MRRFFKSSIAILLILIMLFSLSVGAFTEGKTVLEDVYGQDDIIDQGDDNGPPIIPNPPGLSAGDEGDITVLDDVYGAIPTIEYRVIYFIDSVEVPEFEYT